MKMHTIIGHEILKESQNEILQMASITALEHHEKWDGTGYPYGKKGEDINISARIVSLVDVFDALTSERPYKPAWSIEQTISYIKELSGKQFDPKLVDVFMENLEEILLIKQEHPD